MVVLSIEIGPSRSVDGRSDLQSWNRLGCAHALERRT